MHSNPLRGTGKSDQGIQQCAYCFMNMPPACSYMIRTPCLHHTKRPSPFGDGHGRRVWVTGWDRSGNVETEGFACIRFSLARTGKSDQGIQQCAHCFMNMPSACSDMIRIPCLHQTKRPSPFGAVGMRPTDTAQETSRGRDSHAFSFSLRETEKQN